MCWCWCTGHIGCCRSVRGEVSPIRLAAKVVWNPATGLELAVYALVETDSDCGAGARGVGSRESADAGLVHEKRRRVVRVRFIGVCEAMVR